MLPLLFIVLIVLLVKGKAIRRAITRNFGEQFFPKNYSFLGIGFGGGAVSGIIGSFYDLQGKDRATNSDEVIFVAMIVSILGILLLAIALLFIPNKKPGFWIRYAINSVLYLIGFFPGVLIGYLLLWVGVFIIIGLIGYFGLSGSFGALAGRFSSGGTTAHKCCASCTRYDGGGHCFESPGRVISEPRSEICSGYIP
ncbi:MAG: hypothetical protein LBP56_04640, partial [Odoribacteraceae bacterium]|nr:hypothetical protein [Odoribacteraceae bacterium]